MTHPDGTRNDSFVWLVALLRDVALIAFCIVYILHTL
jgi:hypothetical protein